MIIGIPDQDGMGKALLGSVKQQPQQLKTAVPITAMNFSILDVHQLCFGSANGQVGVVDVSNMNDLSSKEPGEQSSQSNAEVTSIAWNTSVAHIVANAAKDGSVTVWDLKSHKIWCELRAEQHGQAVSDIRWNPNQGLHLLTASSDDRNPVIRIWDLSASTSMPLATLSGHRAGILKTSWCPHDDSLLLSCGKDNMTILWDLYSLQPIAEIPADSSTPSHSTNPVATNPGAVFASGGIGGGPGGLSEQKFMRYDVQWSPLKRGLALTCSLDKKIQIHTVLALATKTGRPPAWMRPLSAVSFGFGGCMLSVFNKNPDPADTRKFVLLRSVQEKPMLVETSQKHEIELVSSSVIDFCHNQQSRASESAEMWGFMKVIFESNARQKLLEHLGFDAEEIASTAANVDDVDQVSNHVASSLAVSEDMSRDLSGVALGMNSNDKEIIKRALIVGNFEAAVECCFRTGNLGDALILASCGGAELWTKTQERFFESESPKRPFLSLVSGVVRGQLDEIISQSEPAKWQETLAILATYAQADDFPRLCIVLGDKLEQVGGDTKHASLCYMCALNLERSVEYWKSTLYDITSAGLLHNQDVTEDHLLALHDFIVKVSVFMQATTTVSNTLSDEIEELFTRYAQALADNGLLVSGSKYVKGASYTAMVLRDRLYRSRASQQCYQVMGQPPEFPFQMVAVEQSRGQIVINSAPQEAIPQAVVANGYTTTGAEHQKSQLHTSTYGASQQQHGNATYGVSQQQGSYQQSYNQQPAQQAVIPAPAQDNSNQLPPGWIALQDPSSGMMYYANQNTGETTWDKPELSTAPTYSVPESMINRTDSALTDASSRGGSTMMDGSTRGRSTAASLVSKYGDGFVTSASHPALADQYGNVGTSNPYSTSSRPGIARVDDRPPPVSGSLNFDSIELTESQQAIKNNLLSIASALQNANLNPVEKRQVAEAEKSVAVLVKKMARCDLTESSVEKVIEMVSALCNRDYGTATSVQTQLANSEWRDHKDWLKGIKILITLASKKL